MKRISVEPKQYDEFAHNTLVDVHERENWISVRRKIFHRLADSFEGVSRLQSASEIFSSWLPGCAQDRATFRKSVASLMPGTSDTVSASWIQIASKARVSNNWRCQALALHFSAECEYLSGDLDQSIKSWGRAIETARRCGEQHLLARLLDRVGVAQFNNGAFGEAKHLFSEAVEHYRNAKDARGEVNALIRSGCCLISMCDYADALAVLTSVFPRTSEINQKAVVLDGLARLRSHEGDSTEARKLWKKAALLFDAIGTSELSSIARLNSACEQLNSGDMTGVSEEFEDLVEELKLQGNELAIGHAFSAMGWIFKDQGRFGSAETFIRRANDIADKASDKVLQSICLHNLAAVRECQGDFDEAKRLLTDSLSLKVQAGDRRGQAASIHQLANISARCGDRSSAVKLWLDSLAIERQIGNSRGQAVTLLLLAQYALSPRDRFSFSCRALNIYRSLKDSESIKGALRIYAACAHEISRTSESISALKELVQLFENDCDVEPMLLSAKKDLGVILVESCRWDEAATIWHELVQLSKEDIGIQRAFALDKLAASLAGLNQFESAFVHWDECLEILGNVRERRYRLMVMNSIASARLESGDVDAATTIWKEVSLTKWDNEIEAHAVALAFCKLGEFAVKQRNWENAHALFEFATRAASDSETPRIEACCLLHLGRVFLQERKVVAAKDSLKRAVDLLSAIEDWPALVEVLIELAHCENTIEYLTQAFWLSYTSGCCSKRTIEIGVQVVMEIGRGSYETVVLANVAAYVADARFSEYPTQANSTMRDCTLAVFSNALSQHGVQSNEVKSWMRQHDLHSPITFAVALNEAVAKIVGDNWAFNPNLVVSFPETCELAQTVS